MKVDLDKLVRFSTYARMVGLNRVQVYQKVKEKGSDLTVVLVDGVKFIKLK